ncbi:hypothetical protein GBA52_028437 [Prunus armeniaca]|nr:hypothetical protein GBA52_028437 [Prunus armeniaca]
MLVFHPRSATIVAFCLDNVKSLFFFQVELLSFFLPRRVDAATPLRLWGVGLVVASFEIPGVGFAWFFSPRLQVNNDHGESSFVGESVVTMEVAFTPVSLLMRSQALP